MSQPNTPNERRRALFSDVFIEYGRLLNTPNTEATILRIRNPLSGCWVGLRIPEVGSEPGTTLTEDDFTFYVDPTTLVHHNSPGRNFCRCDESFLQLIRDLLQARQLQSAARSAGDNNNNNNSQSSSTPQGNDNLVNISDFINHISPQASRATVYLHNHTDLNRAAVSPETSTSQTPSSAATNNRFAYPPPVTLSPTLGRREEHFSRIQSGARRNPEYNGDGTTGRVGIIRTTGERIVRHRANDSPQGGGGRDRLGQTTDPLAPRNDQLQERTSQRDRIRNELLRREALMMQDPMGQVVDENDSSTTSSSSRSSSSSSSSSENSPEMNQQALPLPTPASRVRFSPTRGMVIERRGGVSYAPGDDVRVVQQVTRTTFGPQQPQTSNRDNEPPPPPPPPPQEAFHSQIWREDPDRDRELLNQLQIYIRDHVPEVAETGGHNLVTRLADGRILLYRPDHASTVVTLSRNGRSLDVNGYFDDREMEDAVQNEHGVSVLPDVPPPPMAAFNYRRWNEDPERDEELIEELQQYVARYHPTILARDSPLFPDDGAYLHIMICRNPAPWDGRLVYSQGPLMSTVVQLNHDGTRLNMYGQYEGYDERQRETERQLEYGPYEDYVMEVDDTHGPLWLRPDVPPPPRAALENENWMMEGPLSGVDLNYIQELERYISEYHPRARERAGPEGIRVIRNRRPGDGRLMLNVGGTISMNPEGTRLDLYGSDTPDGHHHHHHHHQTTAQHAQTDNDNDDDAMDVDSASAASASASEEEEDSANTVAAAAASAPATTEPTAEQEQQQAQPEPEPEPIPWSLTQAGRTWRESELLFRLIVGLREILGMDTIPRVSGRLEGVDSHAPPQDNADDDPHPHPWQRVVFTLMDVRRAPSSGAGRLTLAETERVLFPERRETAEERQRRREPPPQQRQQQAINNTNPWSL